MDKITSQPSVGNLESLLEKTESREEIIDMPDRD